MLTLGAKAIALPTDFLRKEVRVREAFETVLKTMIDVFEQALQRKGQAARDRARAIAALCVGGMVLARSIGDRALADELREAAMDIALSLGQWPHQTSERRDGSETARRPASGAGEAITIGAGGQRN